MLVSGSDRVETDGEAERVGLPHDAPHGAFGVQASEVVAAEVLVSGVTGQHVPGRDHDGMLDRHNNFLGSQPGSEPSVAGGEVGIGGPARR